MCQCELTATAVATPMHNMISLQVVYPEDHDFKFDVDYICTSD